MFGDLTLVNPAMRLVSRYIGLCPFFEQHECDVAESLDVWATASLLYNHV